MSLWTFKHHRKNLSKIRGSSRETLTAECVEETSSAERSLCTIFIYLRFVQFIFVQMCEYEIYSWSDLRRRARSPSLNSQQRLSFNSKAYRERCECENMPLNYFLTVSLLAFGVLDISGFSTSVRSEVREIYYPILVWHSAGKKFRVRKKKLWRDSFHFGSKFLQGETCCDHEGNLYVNFLQNEFQNKSYVKVVKIGNTKEDDFTNSLTTHPFDQVSLRLFCWFWS